MRILIHSNAPWVPTGYGQQTRLLIRQLHRLGHDVVVSAFYGLAGAPIEWEDPQDPDGRFIDIFPGGKADYGLDVLMAHADQMKADLVITLMDTWKLIPIASALQEWCKVTGRRLACWMPIDCTPLGSPDRTALDRSGAHPIAMSTFGQGRLTEAGFDPLYVPHSFDPEVFNPATPAERKAAKEGLGLPVDGPVIGMNAANRDAIRKAFPETFQAFRLFLEDRDEAILMVHADPRDRGGHDLHTLAEDLGIAHAIRFTDTYAQTSGQLDGYDMRTWYTTLDLLTNCSYGEGFGLPILEAQACGIPVVVTSASSMPELLTAASAEVPGQDWWNPIHRAWWKAPNPRDMVKAWHAVLNNPGPEAQLDLAGDMVEAMQGYAWDRVADHYWRDALERIMA